MIHAYFAIRATYVKAGRKGVSLFAFDSPWAFFAEEWRQQRRWQIPRRRVGRGTHGVDEALGVSDTAFIGRKRRRRKGGECHGHHTLKKSLVFQGRGGSIHGEVVGMEVDVGGWAPQQRPRGTSQHLVPIIVRHHLRYRRRFRLRGDVKTQIDG